MYGWMSGVIRRSYTRFPLSHEQTSMLWNPLNCTMEFLENGAPCNTSLVSKMTSFIVLKTCTPHYIQTSFRELLFSAVIWETMCSPEKESSSCRNVVCYKCFKTLE